MPSENPEGWNLLVRIVGPIVLFTGLWYLGEQLLGRRRVSNLMEQESKKAFLQDLPHVEPSLAVLPREYRDKVEARKAELKGR